MAIFHNEPTVAQRVIEAVNGNRDVMGGFTVGEVSRANRCLSPSPMREHNGLHRDGVTAVKNLRVQEDVETNVLERLSQSRVINPLQYGDYSKSIQGPQENPQGKIYTENELRAARNRLHRGSKPESFFEGYNKDDPRYRTESWYNQPYKSIPKAVVTPPQPINEASNISKLAGTDKAGKEAAWDIADDRKHPQIARELGRNRHKSIMNALYNHGFDADPERSDRGKFSDVEARRAKRRFVAQESVPIEEVSAKAKLAYLKRKLLRRYFKRKPTAVMFKDNVLPADDSLT